MYRRRDSMERVGEFWVGTGVWGSFKASCAIDSCRCPGMLESCLRSFRDQAAITGVSPRGDPCDESCLTGASLHAGPRPLKGGHGHELRAPVGHAAPPVSEGRCRSWRRPLPTSTLIPTVVFPLSFAPYRQ